MSKKAHKNPFDNIHENPLGEMSCEQEVEHLGQAAYRELYFDEAPFNDDAVDEDTYLIVGWRGSGKTALTQYFSFQQQIPNPLCIEVRAPEGYQQVLAQISERTSESRAMAVAHLRRVWEFVIWSLIIRELRDYAPEIAHLREVDVGNKPVSQFVANRIQYLMEFFSENERTTGARIEQIVDDQYFDQAKQSAMQVAAHRPIIIAIDTLEQYSIKNEALMNALAALIEYAARFNRKYAPKNIHLKVFVAGESFQHMEEAVLLNPLKSVRDPVYLLWRPRDLLRFISWRLYRQLQANGLWRDDVSAVDWEDDDDVLEKVWIPHFGRSLTNAQGNKEDTWPYVLRHTQMRPRQLIRLCNTIANRAIQDGTFPKFREKHIIDGIKDVEHDLTREILNSFSEVYPRVDRIISALMGISKIFKGDELDKRAEESASAWPPGEYSPWRFRQMVTELGIVGRVTRGTPDSEVIVADFEYASTDRLDLTHRDTCAVHPMFYRRLRVDTESIKARVMPFTTK